MTGALVVIAKGSAVQPLVAVLFQLTFLLVVLKLSPYGEDDDDLSAFVSSMTILLMSLGAVMLITDASAEGNQLSAADMAFASFFMVGLTVFCTVFNSCMIFFATEKGGKCRSRMSQSCSRRVSAAAAAENKSEKKKKGGPRVAPLEKKKKTSLDDQKRSRSVEPQESELDDLRSWGGNKPPKRRATKPGP